MMQFDTVEQLLDKIKRGGFKSCTIYDQALTKLRLDLPNFDRYECEDPDDLRQCVENFCSVYTGLYSFVLRKSQGGNASGTTLSKVQLIASTSPVQSGIIQGSETPQQMELRIMEKIQQKMIIEQMRLNNAQLQAKLDGLDSVGGKLTHLVENFVLAKLGGKKAATMQGTEKEHQEKSTEVNEKELTEAYTKLAKLLGPETVIKLANKLDPGDPVISIVINYANS